MVTPVDAVVSWVEGNDPVHRQKRQKAMKHGNLENIDPIAAGLDETRFKDNGELFYCLASIRKFAPWIRRIHLITDNQVPRFLTSQRRKELGLDVVDHRVIFRSYEWALPTFNSRSIETAMCRIPDLAEHFIYFNDDFVITSPVKSKDFFSDGKVVLRGSWQPFKHYGVIGIKLSLLINFLAKKLLGLTRTMYLLGQMRAAKIAGFNRTYYRAPHVPHPIRKTTLSDWFEKHPELFAENIKFQFRDINQYWPVSLANHLEIANSNAILADEKQIEMIRGEFHSKKRIKEKLQAIQAGETLFVCLESMEKVDLALQGEIETVIGDLIRT